MSRLAKSAGAAAIAASLIGGFEGYRNVAYPDPATKGHPWTICYGHTGDVKPGDRATLQECQRILLADVDKHADKVEACITRPMSIETEWGFTSLAFNIGTSAFCKSSVARLYNAGDGQGACDAMLKFNRAAGMVFPGLTRRRTIERQWCLRGLRT